MNLETDEDEHSIEMHLPYVAKVFERYSIIKLAYLISNVYHFVVFTATGTLLLSQFLWDPYHLKEKCFMEES